jgi:flagellar protein FliO/FliZ
MSQSLWPVGLFLVGLCLLPWGVKWLKERLPGALGKQDAGSQAKFVSALAVGPHQRLVTVEVGPENARTVLTLGVTAQSVTCLHSYAKPSETSECGSDLLPDTQGASV